MKAHQTPSVNVQNCFLCDTGNDTGPLHDVSTFDTDNNTRTMINALNDTKLMAHIVGADLIAMETNII